MQNAKWLFLNRLGESGPGALDYQGFQRLAVEKAANISAAGAVSGLPTGTVLLALREEHILIVVLLFKACTTVRAGRAKKAQKGTVQQWTGQRFAAPLV